MLADLITDAIGDGWTHDLNELRKLEPLQKMTNFVVSFEKKANKKSLSDYLYRAYWLSLAPDYLLDCQTKRFHEYKRQLLNVFHVITLYNRIRNGRVDKNLEPRTILFAGKAAPGYYLCKLIIKLIHSVGSFVDADSLTSNKLNVVFVPNYDVSLAQQIMPAAELSEQISTAVYEASGTGIMKFTLIGALTIGTLDGANVEIREEVGEENFFLFGLTAEELVKIRSIYDPHKYYEENKELKVVIDQIHGGYFSPGSPQLFHPITESLFRHDPYFVFADYASYIQCQEKVNEVYRDQSRWTKMAVLNVARSGKFSSDRAIRQYAESIWGTLPVTP